VATTRSNKAKAPSESGESNNRAGKVEARAAEMRGVRRENADCALSGFSNGIAEKSTGDSVVGLEDKRSLLGFSA